MSLLDISHLNIRFPGQEKLVVDDVSLTLEAGDMLALVGESGSGKSLTALSILQLLPPQASWQCGHLQVNGEDTLHYSPAQLRGLRGGQVGMIFQEPLSALNPLHTVEKQICETLFIHQGMSRKQAHHRCLELLEQVQLSQPDTLLKRYPHQLSGGQRQRVMIAMALANEPHLLIADEPTTALDVTVQAGIMALLKQLQQELQLGILFISHDIGLVKRHAEKVAVMQQGRIVETGSTAKVLGHPEVAYTRRLLDSEPDGKAHPPLLSTKVLLQTHNVNVSFSQASSKLFRKSHFHAVENVSIQLGKGETLGIVGESGSGKSTLAMAILQLQKYQGKIIFDDTPLGHLNRKQLQPFRQRLQIVFQDPFGSLNPHMTVGQIVCEGLAVHEPGLSAKQRESRLCTQLTDVGLDPDVRHRYPHEFSGGQRQRIAIARSLILRPDLIILDEPTSALDRSIQFQILSLLKKLQQEHGLSYLFISHDLKVVRSISHHLVVMQAGKIVEVGDTETLFRTPRMDYTKRLVEAAFL
jgi:microcin C transport system ATP-binding protein